MRSTKSVFAALTLLLLIVLLTSVSPIGLNLVRATPPNSPHEGSGSNIVVYEFARNDSILFSDGTNDTTFSYLGSWFPTSPTSYRGYRLYASVSDLRRTEDPVPNGDFDQYDEPGNNWTLTESTGGIVSSIDNVTGGNPGDCLDVELKYGNVPNIAHAYIDNVFDYTSAIPPDSLTLKFDVKYSADISTATWLEIKVAVRYQESEVGSWSNTTDVYHPTNWDSHSVNTGTVNGTVTLRIMIQKQGGGNANVKGHVYFDNFQYIIGTDSKPSEVALKLNDTAISDTIVNEGEINIYADPSQKDEAIFANCWSTTQTFEFNSTYAISFDYEYIMYVKSESLDPATTQFSAPVDQNPTWEINYTVPSGRPPLGHTGYSYGLYLLSDWSLSEVKDSTGQSISAYTYNSITRFIRLDDDVASTGDTFSIYATSLNYVIQIYPQKSASSSGPWTNLTVDDYYIKGDWLRVMALLRPIGASGNYANVSLFFPNETLWQSAVSPADITFHDINDTLTTSAWQIPEIENSSAGSEWLITVSFNTNTQCGMRQQSYAVVIETLADKKAPGLGMRILWSDTVKVNVTWQNQDNNAYITDAAAQIRYVDRYLQVQYLTLTPNGQGGYSTNFATDLMSPDRNAEFYVELFRYGYVNASYNDGTHLTFTINLVNDLEYSMIKPSQKTGTDEYTGQTSRAAGFTSQVRFYDSYQSGYVRNDSGIWQSHVRVNYTYYEDTGSGWNQISTGSFIPNASSPTVFYKYDAPNWCSPTAQKVKYEATMRIVAASWDYEQQNFTIIIEIVSFATDLDALRTTITYPPSGTGDGWLQYNNNTDTYEVYVYWNELFNITVYYENVSNVQGISGASVNVTIEGIMYNLDDQSGGYYNYTVNTSSLSVGTTTYLTVNATYPAHAIQTIIIRLRVTARATDLTKDHPGSTADLPYDDDFVVTFTFRDTVPASPNPIVDASWSIVGYIGGKYSVVNNGDGTYTVTFEGDVPETIYYVTITFSKTNYQSQPQNYDITVRPIHTQGTGNAESVSVPWGDNVTINLAFNDTDHGYTGISGASISLNWQDNIEGVDYWIIDNGDGSYLVILNTTKVATGTQPYTLSITLSETHYDNAQTIVSFEVRDHLTALYITFIYPSTSVPWGDNLTIILTFNDTDDSFSTIEEAGITCDWDVFYWSYSYNAALEAYILVIRTISRDEGSNTVHIYATRTHYRTGITLQGFVVRSIQTGYTTDPPYVPSHPWGENITIQVDYLDLDHGGEIPFADISTDWTTGYYTIYYYGNGTYHIELNTTCLLIGNNQIRIILSREHYANQTVPVTITLDPITIYVEVLIPSGAQVTAEYNEEIVIQVNVTDYFGRIVNYATALYHWAGRAPLSMTFEGNGIYNVTFFANEDVGTYVITIQVNKTNYQTGIGTVMLYILPTDTSLITLTPAFQLVVGESFTISVNFSTIDSVPITDATVLYSWATNRTGTLLHVGNGIYNATLNSTGLDIGLYTVYVTASGPSLVERLVTISVQLTVISTELVPSSPFINVDWGDNFTLLVYFRNTFANSSITGASITYQWGNYTGYLQPTNPGAETGWYNISLPSDIQTAGTYYTVNLRASKSGYHIAMTSVSIYINQQQTQLTITQVEAHCEEAGIIIPLNGTSWTVPRDDVLWIYFNYTDATDNPITNAIGSYVWELGSGTLEYIGGLYVVELNLTGITPRLYSLNVYLSRENYRIGQSPALQVNVILVSTAIVVVAETQEVITGDTFSIQVYFNDTYHNWGIRGANLTLSLQGVTYMLSDMGDGNYLSPPLQVFSEGTFPIVIEASGAPKYALATQTITLIVSQHPIFSGIFRWGTIAGVIGIIALSGWLLYTRVFSIPWLVRKMRRMSRTIGKGQTPILSKRETEKIASRLEQVIDFARPYYDVINIPVPLVAVPSITGDLDEREAEAEAIWESLRDLPRLGREQKLELFREMKSIPPNERVWFLEDLKRQMADGTRFPKPKAPPEPMLPPEVEEKIQQRLDALPHLGEEEKLRIIAQLRGLPEEEHEEILRTIEEESQAPQVEEEEHPLDKYPTLSPEDKQRLLEQLPKLPPEEQEKVLKTLKEKLVEKDTKDETEKPKPDAKETSTPERDSEPKNDEAS